MISRHAHFYLGSQNWFRNSYSLFIVTFISGYQLDRRILGFGEWQRKYLDFKSIIVLINFFILFRICVRIFILNCR